MIRKNTDKGVSPVIGVILMVAITVIIAAVVANFVLDMGGSLEQDADATVDISQSANFDTTDYEVRITAQQLSNADYIEIQVVGNGDVDESTIDDCGVDTVTDDVPDTAHMTNSGDACDVTDLDGDSEIQVLGGLDGSENVITTYEVEDTQDF